MSHVQNSRQNGIWTQILQKNVSMTNSKKHAWARVSNILKWFARAHHDKFPEHVQTYISSKERLTFSRKFRRNSRENSDKNSKLLILNIFRGYSDAILKEIQTKIGPISRGKGIKTNSL